MRQSQNQNRNKNQNQNRKKNQAATLRSVTILNRNQIKIKINTKTAKDMIKNSNDGYIMVVKTMEAEGIIVTHEKINQNNSATQRSKEERR